MSNEITQMQQQLASIHQSITMVQHCTQWMPLTDMVMEANVARIKASILAIQTRVAHPAVMRGLCCEALNQVAHVYDLITECEGVPNQQQLTSIGFACELAADRIRRYQQMSRHAANINAVAEAAPSMEA